MFNLSVHKMWSGALLNSSQQLYQGGNSALPILWMRKCDAQRGQRAYRRSHSWRFEGTFALTAWLLSIAAHSFLNEEGMGGLCALALCCLALGLWAFRGPEHCWFKGCPRGQLCKAAASSVQNSNTDRDFLMWIEAASPVTGSWVQRTSQRKALLPLHIKHPFSATHTGTNTHRPEPQRPGQ